MMDSWEWVEQYVNDSYVFEYDDIRDERPLDAASAMYEAGMSNYEIIRVLAQVWNASFDACEQGKS